MNAFSRMIPDLSKLIGELADACLRVFSPPDRKGPDGNIPARQADERPPGDPLEPVDETLRAIRALIQGADERQHTAVLRTEPGHEPTAKAAPRSAQKVEKARARPARNNPGGTRRGRSKSRAR